MNYKDEHKEIHVLNGYAGIGGNRKLWPNWVKVTAIENNPKVAAYYKSKFPQDEVIIGDAHEFLLKYFSEFDFIWMSPECPTHSRARLKGVMSGQINHAYPDMQLYQEIILLQKFFKNPWVIENVIPYYTPLIPATFKIERHLFWSNFICENKIFDYSNEEKLQDVRAHSTRFGFNLSESNIPKKEKTLRNLINPELGLHILNKAFRIKSQQNNIQLTAF